AAAGLVAGQLRLGAGGPSGAGGSLVINHDGATKPVIVTQKAGGAASGGSLTVIADSIDGSGAEDLTIRATPASSTSIDPQSAILFDGDVILRTGRSLTLLSPMLGTLSGGPSSVTLQSSRVALDGVASTPVAADTGQLGGSLIVDADLIDVSRTVVLGC